MMDDVGLRLEMKVGDLFSAPSSASLAHCISRDCKLGKGIAKIFREKFGRIREIENCKAGVGDIAVLPDGSRFIYNLVTKERYYGKPTYDTLRQSLEKMREHARRSGVTEICMPKIGCGLDLLQWAAVRTLLENVFKEETIHITVYVLDGKDLESQGNGNRAKNTNPPHHKGNTNRHRPPQEPSSSSSKQKTMKDFFKQPSKDQEREKVTPPTTGKNEAVEDTGALTGQVEVGFGFSTCNPLPNVFTGLKIYCSEAVANVHLLRRNVIAMDGTVVEDKDLATHIVYAAGNIHEK